uniref:Uncharacterized protein n=1 Tax=Xiphophorus maculatus TaxID=8083 RepID=A0A3B5Q3W2_XIPMA
MSLKVTLLVVWLVSQCWSAPYRRNWTPQAILYLKGARKKILFGSSFNVLFKQMGSCCKSLEIVFSMLLVWLSWERNI